MNAMDREAAVMFHTYKRLPLSIERGEGVFLYDTSGKKYLDLFSGVAVNALGYAHPGILKAVHDQAGRYLHLSNYYLQDSQLELAERLTRASGYPRAFLANSGTEAVEGAIKIARAWGADGLRKEILSFSNAFHGRTLGALSLMDRSKYRDGFEPFLDHCKTLPFNDSIALRGAIGDQTLAVILECIQGEGGIRPISAEFASTLNGLHTRFGFLLVADEIQSGIGRTGKFFGFQHFDLEPDIVVVAKPIGGGLPLGAILGGARVADTLKAGMHGTTFGGNPVACAAGAVVLREVVEGGVMQNAAEVGQYMKDQLALIAADFPSLVSEVRGYGLMLGMELSEDGESFVTEMREQGVLINCTDRKVLRFLPPLIIEREQVASGLKTLRSIFASRIGQSR